MFLFKNRRFQGFKGYKHACGLTASRKGLQFSHLPRKLVDVLKLNDALRRLDEYTGGDSQSTVNPRDPKISAN